MMHVNGIALSVLANEHIREDAGMLDSESAGAAVGASNAMGATEGWIFFVPPPIFSLAGRSADDLVVDWSLTADRGQNGIHTVNYRSGPS
jgi:hypothetical protein